MIDTWEEALAIMHELDNGGMTLDPVDFWAELGWDMDILHCIAQAGVASGMEGDPDHLMVAMQMGAALALKGLEKKNESRPYEHLAIHETP